jgi:hypothetical protein
MKGDGGERERKRERARDGGPVGRKRMKHCDSVPSSLSGLSILYAFGPSPPLSVGLPFDDPKIHAVYRQSPAHLFEKRKKISQPQGDEIPAKLKTYAAHLFEKKEEEIITATE